MGPVYIVLIDGGVDVGTGPVEIDVLVQLLQRVQLRAVSCPRGVIALATVDQRAASLLLEPPVHGVE